MSERLQILTKLKIAVPVCFLFATFIFFILAVFLVDASLPRIFGALVTFIAGILWIIARVQLGDAVTQGRLVTTGLYGEFRHPIYLFSTISFLGVAIFMWLGLLFIPVAGIAVVQIVRARREERMLAANMGRRYLRYKKRTMF